MLNAALVRTTEHLTFDNNPGSTDPFDEPPQIPVSELKHAVRLQIHSHVVSKDGHRAVQIDGRKVAQAASIINTVMMLTGLDAEQMKPLLEHAEKERLWFGSRFSALFVNNHIGTQQELRPLLHRAVQLAPTESGERMVLCWLLVTGKLHEL